MALIMVGAPMREIMVEQYFAKLQQFVDEKAPSITSSSWHRRINLDDSFPKERFQPPHIKFAIPRSTMSLSQFETHLEPLAPTPLVITGSLGHWPAFDERPWSRPSYFVEKTFHGKRLVPIELGSSYTDEDWGQKIIPFKNFMNEYLLTPQGHQTGYLAQHDLFTQIPALRNDLAVPDFCYVSPPPPVQGTPVASEEYTKVEEPLLNLWMGPAGTISPLHHDAYHNVLCQVVGKKYIRLYSPEQSDCVYPMSEANGVDMSNTSRVPIDLFEISCLDESNGEFPLFQGAKYVETVLNEGECLYIPIGWWHYVRSLTVSISVSFWWN
jgi:lysine-specific demethylase 8